MFDPNLEVDDVFDALKDLRPRMVEANKYLQNQIAEYKIRIGILQSKLEMLNAALALDVFNTSKSNINQKG